LNWQETNVNRREALALAALGAAWTVQAQPPGQPRYRAVVFDAFAILDPRGVFRVVTTILPSRSMELFDAWRIRQFEYQWLRALAGRYVDFEQATEDALVFAGRSLGTAITAEQKRALLQSYFDLRAWSDVAEGLSTIKARGLQTAVLSNATPRILVAAPVEELGTTFDGTGALMTDLLRFIALSDRG
jgi:2-haloacid dehalogenase